MKNCSYLNRCSKNIGTMLHYAINVQHINGSEFLKMFINSGLSKEIEDCNPKYTVGMSGIELCYEVLNKVFRKDIVTEYCSSIEKSPEYWVGWVLIHYNWYSGASFKTILNTISFKDLLNLYPVLHEADIRKCFEVFDAHFADCESSLKTIRKKCGLTQEELALKSGVSLNTIRAYERKSKCICKAQADILLKLSDAMKCNMEDLIS